MKRELSESNRSIIHADFDAFYASVEQRDNPDIVGKPVVVGGSHERRGVVASASYEARSFGIRSAMPMSKAVNLCPDLIRRSARFDVYREVSVQVMKMFSEITDLVEPLSLDEAYIDVSNLEDDQRTPPEIARSLKREVQSLLGLTISVGIATSKSVAKIASDKDKPDGFTIVRPGTEKEFLSPLPVQSLWGIGPKTTKRLETLEIRTIGQLSRQSKTWFSEFFGVNGNSLLLMSQGIDNRPVVSQRIRKSYSSETTLRFDTSDREQLEEIVQRLSQDVGNSLMRRGMKGKTVKLKLRDSDSETYTRQVTLTESIQLSSEISQAALELLKVELSGASKFRLVGVGISGFRSLENQEDEVQLKLKGL